MRRGTYVEPQLQELEPQLALTGTEVVCKGEKDDVRHRVNVGWVGGDGTYSDHDDCGSER